MKNKSISPAGYSRICPYLMVESVGIQLDFLKAVFDAQITESLKHKDGTLQHAEARIGDTIIMMGKSQPAWPATQSSNYVFVEDVDEAFLCAIKIGATSLMEPGDRFYGYREGGFKDSQGNTWWVAHVLEELSEEEMQRRLSDLKK